MEQPYTQELLVQFIYKETPVLETFEIEDAIENNEVLAHQHTTLVSAFHRLPKASFMPTNQTVKRILAYSKETSLRVSC